MDENRKAIVTGASSGIGQEISKLLVSMGIEVYGIGRNFEKTMIESEKFHRIICDITKTDDLIKIINRINESHQVSILINCAGVGFYGLHEELNPSKIQELVRTNLEAPMIITNLLLRDLKKNRGIIINISSVTAHESNPHGCVYGATKAGLTSFSHSLFDEARKYGLKVVNIEPDMTETNLYRNADFTCADEEEARLLPEDIANAVKLILEAEDRMVITDLCLKPQFHKIKRKSNSKN